MLTAPYINDNPYRLLGVGSAIRQPDLQLLVESADRTEQSGILPLCGLLQVFGDEMLPLCAEKVRMLGTDPMERSVYRMFWPFDYPILPTSKGTLSDLLNLDSSGTEPTFHTLQLRFVIYWVEYVMKPSAYKIQDILEAFDNLCKENRLAAFLTELLRADGEEQDCAAQIGVQAQNVILERMLVVFRRQAMQWWESDKVSTLTTLVQTLTKASFSESIIDNILADVGAAGNQEASAIQTAIANNRQWTPLHLPGDIAQVKRLRLFAVALQGHLAAANQWREMTEARLLHVARSMREQANILSREESGYDQAAQIFEEIQPLPLPEEESQQIKSAAALLQTLIQARDKRIWAGITPITVEPKLWTMNGFGCTIYGNTPFAGNPEWYFVTCYIVFGFIPVFPIRRYLVSKAPGRGWYFHRSAPLTLFSKWHLGTSITVIILFILFGSIPRELGGATSGGAPASQHKIQQSGNPNSRASGANTSAESNDAKQKLLNDERYALDGEVKAAEDDLDRRRSHLDSIAEQLEADGKNVDESNPAAVKAYNIRVDGYKQAKKLFQVDVDAYDKKVKRINEIDQQLGQ